MLDGAFDGVLDGKVLGTADGMLDGMLDGVFDGYVLGTEDGRLDGLYCSQSSPSHSHASVLYSPKSSQ